MKELVLIMLLKKAVILQILCIKLMKPNLREKKPLIDKTLNGP